MTLDFADKLKIDVGNNDFKISEPLGKSICASLWREA